MTFDSIILAAIGDELNRKLKDARVQTIHQPESLDVVLTLRTPGVTHSLLVSADATAPRIHLTSAKKPNPKTPPGFCMLLRKHLEGARFSIAEQIDFDRILHLRFLAYDGERLTLVVEIMGKHSNIILINGEGRILGTIKPVGRQKSRYRQVLPGLQYTPPPKQDKLNPLNVSKEVFENLLKDSYIGTTEVTQGQLAKWLCETFVGISPFAAWEVVTRSGGDMGRVAEEFMSLIDAVRRGEFDPVLITDDEGKAVAFYPFPSVQYPKANQHERNSVSTVADMYYISAIRRQDFAQAKDEFVAMLEREVRAREHSLEAIREGIRECENAERVKQIGELILSQVALVPEGSESAELVDYYDPDASKIRVRLDPKLSAAENAEAYFRRYHKLVSGAEALEDRLRETESEIRLLRKVLLSAETISSEDQIESLKQLLAGEGIKLHKQEAAATEKRRDEFDGHRISKVEREGWEILVGLNSEANDYLLTRVARPTDVWVHVKASPSAHVIIRTNGKPDAVPRSVLLAAAELAARHSDSKHSSLVPVDYTLRKYVRKPKGAPSGKAIYQNEKTVYVTP